MASQHRKYGAADLTVLPWPQPSPAGPAGPEVTTTWVLGFDRPLAAADAGMVAERVRMHDPALDMAAVLRDERCLVLTFTWPEGYGADALSRSAVALRLIVDVLGGPAHVLGRPAADWPFLR